MARIIVTLEVEDETTADWVIEGLKARYAEWLGAYVKSEIRVGTSGSFDDAG